MLSDKRATEQAVLDERNTLKLRRIVDEGLLNHVLWAAYRSDHYSADADVGGRPGGAFTYFFCRHIRDTAGKVSRSDLIKLVRASLKHEALSRVLQLECPDNFKKTEVFE